MNYSDRIFNKNIRDLSFEDIEDYFKEPREESEILEFKSGYGDFEEVFNKNILRTIAAFLNSSGGVLIWGTPKDVALSKGKPKVCIGELIPLTIHKEKDHLINRISSAISYMPTGVRVEKLKKGNQYLYIFEVDESPSKPHQYNGIYYIRLDGQSRPAPHYVVDALFKQVKFAELEGSLDFRRVSLKDGTLYIDFGADVRNKSKFIVDKSLSLSVHTLVGCFKHTGSETLSIEQNGPLHYGPPKSFKNQIVIELDDLKASNGICEVFFYFAGENSVARVSRYKLDFHQLMTSGDAFDNATCSFVKDAEENIHFD